MSKDFNISLEELLDGEIKKKENKLINKFIITTIIFLSIIILIFIISYKSNFTFKTLSSSCPEFNISGSLAYNDQKSSIYISNIEYCGEKNNDLYKEFEWVLYESHNDTDKKISSSSYKSEEPITLEKYLETVTITIDNYKKTCKNYSENSLYLSVIVKDTNNKNITYKIPLSLESNCTN